MRKPAPKPTSILGGLLQAGLRDAFYGAATDALDGLTEDAKAKYGEGHIATRLSGVARGIVGSRSNAERQALEARSRAAAQTGRLHLELAAGLTMAGSDLLRAQQEEQRNRQDALDCYERGEHFLDARQAERAFEWYAKGAQKGHVQSIHMVAWCFDTATGTARNAEAAEQFYRTAANAGNLKSKSNLAKLLYLTRCFVEAAQWAEIAAREGAAGGQYIAGLCYMRGEGVAADRTKAASYFRQAAAQGMAAATETLKQFALAPPTAAPSQQPGTSTWPDENPHSRGSRAWARHELRITDESPSNEQINAVWKKLIIHAHTDHGGDEEWTKVLNEARAVLRS